MKFVKTIVLASTLLAVGGLNAWAQSGSSQQRGTGTPAPGAGNISAATHCLDSAGVARLKSEAQGRGTGSAQTSGTAANTGTARPSAPSGSAPGGNVLSGLPKC